MSIPVSKEGPTREKLSPNFYRSCSRYVRKVCLHCEKDFKSYVSQKRKFCQMKCSSDFQKSQAKSKKTKYCLICSKGFIPKRPDSPGLYCSYKCTGISNRKEIVMRSGYRSVFNPVRSTSKQGYALEHRIVFEDHCGVESRENEVVHHINRIKDDNSINNLMLLSDISHKRLHAHKFMRGDGGEILGQH